MGTDVICARAKLGKVVRIEHLQGAKTRNNVSICFSSITIVLKKFMSHG